MSILRAALAHDTPACQAAACRALFDLALCIGPARVDAGLHAPTPEGTRSIPAPEKVDRIDPTLIFCRLLFGQLIEARSICTQGT